MEGHELQNHEMGVDINDPDAREKLIKMMSEDLKCKPEEIMAHATSYTANLILADRLDIIIKMFQASVVGLSSTVANEEFWEHALTILEFMDDFYDDVDEYLTSFPEPAAVAEGKSSEPEVTGGEGTGTEQV